jgi:hypothetical protein
MRLLGRTLQALGLAVVPLGLYHGLAHGETRGALAIELAIVAAGAAAFLLGRRLEGVRG